MMKLSRLLSMTAAMTMAATSLAHAVSVEATATVTPPISISKVSDMSFASFSTTAGGSLSSNPMTSPPGTIIVSGTRSNASFNTSGVANQTYTINYPTSGLQLEGSGAPMPLSLSFANGEGASQQFDGAGTDTFALVGTLTVNAGQATGAYTETFDVTVNY